jgi:hypothetical protein
MDDQWKACSVAKSTKNKFGHLRERLLCALPSRPRSIAGNNTRRSSRGSCGDRDRDCERWRSLVSEDKAGEGERPRLVPRRGVPAPAPAPLSAAELAAAAPPPTGADARRDTSNSTRPASASRCGSATPVTVNSVSETVACCRFGCRRLGRARAGASSPETKNPLESGSAELHGRGCCRRCCGRGGSAAVPARAPAQPAAAVSRFHPSAFSLDRNSMATCPQHGVPK